MSPNCRSNGFRRAPRVTAAKERHSRFREISTFCSIAVSPIGSTCASHRKASSCSSRASVRDAAWTAYSGRAQAFPEVPSVAGHSHLALQNALRRFAHGGSNHRARWRAADRTCAGVARRRRGTGAASPPDVAGPAGASPCDARRACTPDRTRRELSDRSRRCGDPPGRGSRSRAFAVPPDPHVPCRLWRDATCLGVGAPGSSAARDALLLTGDGIEDVARAAGYESRTAFDRAFARRFGATRAWCGRNGIEIRNFGDASGLRAV